MEAYATDPYEREGVSPGVVPGIFRRGLLFRRGAKILYLGYYKSVADIRGEGGRPPVISDLPNAMHNS